MARKMKDSGIEWIGEIPEGWEVHRMKSCISQRDGGAWGDEATGETGDCICLRIADFDYEHFRFTDSNNLTIRHYASPIIKKLLLQKNDILIEKSGGGEKTPVGRTVLFDKEYPALFANFMDRLRCSDFILPQYLQYVFVTFYKNRYTQNYIKQTTGIQNLDLSSMLADEFVPVPNLNEQKLIVCYLESKCSKIDNLLFKTRSSIEEYKKLKQAVITQAVTKGVRGEREMKDSGVEWIGEIPKEWKCQKLKYTIFPQNRPVFSTDEIITCFRDGIVTLRKNRREDGFTVSFTEHGYQGVEIGDLVIHGMDAFAGAIGCSDSRGKTTPVVHVCTTTGNNRFFMFFLRHMAYSNIFMDFSNGIRIRSSDFRNFTKLGIFDVLVPPIAEQNEIADYLDAKCTEIDKLIAKKEQLVKELESYKKSLIYEVVTGKREV